MELGEVNTLLTTDSLHYTVKDYLGSFPSAVNHVFLRPYLWEKAAADSIFFALEICCYLFLLIFCIYKYPEKFTQIHPFVLCTVIFSLSVLLLIGYIVPAYGAIIRYRSIFLPFLLIPIINMINLKHIIYKNI